MENNNVKFTNSETFITELLARLTTPEKMEAFRHREGFRYRNYMDDLGKLIQVKNIGDIVRIILTLRSKQDVISCLCSGEPIRMVMLSNGLLIAMKRHRGDLNDKELKILDDVHDLLNLLI